MENWVRICGMEEAPPPGEAREVEANGVTLCLAHVGGELHALDNWCPHRQGPLGQGWIEGNAVVCPWHAWAFDCRTGVVEPPEQGQVRVFPLRTEGDAVLVDLA